MGNDYIMAMPSLGREDVMTALDVLEDVDCEKFVFVDNAGERRRYKQALGKRATIVDCHAGKPWYVSHLRNRILDHFSTGAHVIYLSDDLKGLFVLDSSHKANLRALTPVEIERLIARGFADCAKVKTKLWGVVAVKNSFYMKNTVASRVFINDCFCGVIVGSLRWDEGQQMKADYDWTIQHVVKYGCVIRYNSICLEAPYQSKMKGGCAGYRTEDNERASIEMLKAKWPHFVHDNPRRFNEVLLRFPRGTKRTVTKKKIKRGC